MLAGTGPPINCIAAVPNVPAPSVITADTEGRVTRVDLREMKMSGVYKGFGGSVRSLSIHPTLPLMATGGLDRTLRIHHLDSRKMLQRIYVKQRLNSVEFSCEGSIKAKSKKHTSVNDQGGKEDATQEEEREEDEEETWAKLDQQTADDKQRQRERKIKKRKRKSESDDSSFTPSTTFTGARSGYVFKKGRKGVGYYRDA